MATTPYTRIRHLTTVCFAILAALLASCSGGSMTAGLDDTENWPAHGWQGSVRSGSFAVVAIDAQDNILPEVTAKLALEIAPLADGQRVRIKAHDLEACNYIGIHLRYERRLMHPCETRCGEGWENKALFLGVTQIAGTVAAGVATIGGAPTLAGDLVLAEIDFEDGAFLGTREISSLSKTPATDLAFDGATAGLLLWSNSGIADTNQDGVTNVADIAPLGIHFGKDSTAADWTVARVADTTRDGMINIQDLTPIGIHWMEHITGYQVVDSSSETGQYDPISGATVAFSAGTIPGGGGIRQFSYQLAAPEEGRWYAVVAMEDTNLATNHSNVVQYSTSINQPPQNLRGSSDGTNIQLVWDAPSSGTPDGYYLYVNNVEDMTGATQVNLSPITGTNFAVPTIFPPTNSYYFAVVAIYGAALSGYSNIYHYVPGSDAPQNLTAQRVNDHVQLDWEAPSGGAPEGYNAYIGSDATLSDAIRMNGATLITALTYDVPTLFSPDAEHYFGVKASTGGIEGEYSNIFKYEPGAGPDTTPPVWQGDPGVTTVAPDNGQVTVSWSAAVDADTPPVEYLLFYVQDGTEFDWSSPNEIYDSSIKSAPVVGLTNNVKYKFAVRARDSVTPVPNVTTNENFLYATPMSFPINGVIGDMLASDVASVRMEGEEVPRIAAVNHSDELWYATYDGENWVSVNLNTVIASVDRKYHVQMLGIGEDVHIVYGTPGGIFEIYGPKDADPSTWTQKTIVGSGNNQCYGIGFSYSPSNSYLAVVYATKVSTEQLFYSDRDVSGDWSAPVSIMAGDPQIWQCDMAINEFDGSQWVVAANGQAGSSGDDLKFHYLHRDSRTGTWTGGASGYGGDVMVVEIDPNIHQPVVICAEVRNVSVPMAGEQPVSDATAFAWDGSTWLKTVLEQGDCTFNESDFTLDTILTGQDPQLVFSPTGKAVAIWTKLDFLVDMLEYTADLTGDWRYAQRTGTIWGSTISMIAHITSSNSVTAGEGYQHCVTCDLGFLDSGDYESIIDKYSTRNDYVEGDLYYRRQSW